MKKNEDGARKKTKEKLSRARPPAQDKKTQGAKKLRASDNGKTILKMRKKKGASKGKNHPKKSD